MKNIRIDFYRFRLRKGRAYVLLQHTDANSEFVVPYRYVDSKEHIAWRIKSGYIEDDQNGDLVIYDCTLNDCHMKKNDKEWIPINNIFDLNIQRNESYKVYYNILCFFLRRCPTEGELGIHRRVSEMLEDVKVNIAKKEYVDALKEALERKRWVVLDARMTPPDPELIKKELETLEHFRLYKPPMPPMVPMNLRDGMLIENDRYSYEPIDWEEFGAEIKPFPMFPFGRYSSPFTEELDTLEEE